MLLYCWSKVSVRVRYIWVYFPYLVVFTVVVGGAVKVIGYAVEGTEQAAFDDENLFKSITS